MGLSDGWKSFPIGLAVLIQYRSVTATQPPSHPASHVVVAITLNAKASSLKIFIMFYLFLSATVCSAQRFWFYCFYSVVHTHLTILSHTFVFEDCKYWKKKNGVITAVRCFQCRGSGTGICNARNNHEITSVTEPDRRNRFGLHYKPLSVLFAGILNTYSKECVLNLTNKLWSSGKFGKRIQVSYIEKK